MSGAGACTVSLKYLRVHLIDFELVTVRLRPSPFMDLRFLHRRVLSRRKLVRITLRVLRSQTITLTVVSGRQLALARLSPWLLVASSTELLQSESYSSLLRGVSRPFIG